MPGLIIAVAVAAAATLGGVITWAIHDARRLQRELDEFETAMAQVREEVEKSMREYEEASKRWRKNDEQAD